jgi:hypothetical protein
MNKTNMKDNHSLTIPVLSSPIDAVTKKTGVSVFTDQILSMDDYNGLFITPRIGALNFRHRYSEANYSSDWHMAGDATLLIIRSGTLRIGLRNGDYKDFSAGDMFIAKDRLQKEEVFNSDLHGHTAAVIGEHNLTAVHIKLSED